MKWTGSEGEECDAEASFVDELCDVADAKRVKVEREEEYDSDGSADTIDVINVEVWCFLTVRIHLKPHGYSRYKSCTVINADIQFLL